MISLLRRRLKYFLRLDFPVHVTMGNDDFVGHYPDLPQVGVRDSDLTRLYLRLDAMRRAWITEQITTGHEVPLPMSTFDEHGEVLTRRNALA